MIAFLFKRLLAVLPTLVLVSMLIFGLQQDRKSTRLNSSH